MSRNPHRHPARAALLLGAGVLFMLLAVMAISAFRPVTAPERSASPVAVASPAVAPARPMAERPAVESPPAPIPGGWRILEQNLERPSPGLENWVVLIERDVEPRRLVAVSQWGQDPQDGQWREESQNVYVADRILARPAAGVPESALRAFFADYGLRVRQAPTGAESAWIVEWDNPSPERFTEIYEDLNAQTHLFAAAAPIAADFDQRIVEQVRK